MRRSRKRRSRKRRSPSCRTSVVVSDIDDTLVCSGNDRLAGIDPCTKEGEKKDIYPGAVEFEMALARGLSAEESEDRIILLSARPSFLGMKGDDKAIGEKLTKKMNGALDLEGSLYGKLTDVLSVRPYGKMGMTKIRSLLTNKELYGNGKLARGCFAFVGDSGQGDELVARALIGFENDPWFSSDYAQGPPWDRLDFKDRAKLAELRERTTSVWIHDVGFSRESASYRPRFRVPGDLDYLGSRVLTSYEGKIYVRFGDYKTATRIALEYGII